mmetsp:Transcript_4687/g.7274  ORF Transcript_4687/g.7274 Transcript_4687/m.7274 type:complete len:82 (+) Transcript_4687:157-402(+)|eukprot:CAMPEP_0184661060 /NCGR_PEP_ID=MMETSP0308-20130426/36812_1 /TAXON_ID=38269 /ORGANISM="Gloeochaete witrockiana, Strain SAG 46.84" /LENGTH=81 /DNA_ID=CAMNT_0027102119 /DNA_START=72 /DNA_END=317 /DNA_ORIENTATION=+
MATPAPSQKKGGRAAALAWTKSPSDMQSPISAKLEEKRKRHDFTPKVENKENVVRVLAEEASTDFQSEEAETEEANSNETK